MLVGVQLSVLGLYLPPVFVSPESGLKPPQTIISLPVHTAVCSTRSSGALVVLVAVQLSVAGIVSAAGVQITAKIVAAPNNHFSASPHRRVTPSGRGGISGASRGPSVGDRVVPPAAVKPSNWVVMKAAPDDHFAACPHCRMLNSGSGGVSGARSCPGIVECIRLRD